MTNPHIESKPQGLPTTLYRVLAGLPVLLGSIVIFGWHSHLTALIQILPEFVPMQYNTALCFIFAGTALLMLQLERLALSRAAATLCLLVASLTMLQYLASINLGIDEMFMEHYVTVQTPDPGRMAPNTALSFILTSACILLHSWKPQSRVYSTTCTLLAGVVFGLGFIALFGYLTNLVPAFGWGSKTAMAVHTAIGFLLLATSLLGWLHPSRHMYISFRYWLLSSLVPLFLTVVGCLQMALIVEAERIYQNLVSYQADKYSLQLEQRFLQTSTALTRMAERWNQNAGQNENIWRVDAKSYLNDIDYIEEIRLANPQSGLIWLEENQQRLPSSSFITIDDIIKRDTKKTLYLSLPGRVASSSLVVIAMPLISESSNSQKNWLVAIISVDALANNILLSSEDKNLAILVTDANNKLVFEKNIDSELANDYRKTRSILENTLGWHIAFTPSKQLLLKNAPPFIKVSIGLSLFLTLGLLLLVNQVFKLREQENQIRDKNQQLDEMVSRLSESNQQLERFAYVCSHDLQEPVRMVQSFTQLLEKNISDTLDEKNKNYLHYITDGAERARAMVTDILNYSRLDQAMDQLEEVPLSEICEKISDTLRNDKENNASSFSWEEHLPTITAVPTQIFQLLINLVSNGLKFNKSDEPTVHISAEKDDAYWLIKIEDNGIGIEKEHQRNIFNVFSRLHSKAEFPGTGIGLAICKKIVEKQGGKLLLNSTLNKGSCFIIYWPIHSTAKGT